MKLPIAIVIPTLNCREKLVRHLDAIEEWLPHVGQIIAIDSQSTDGTFELLQERLLPYGAQVISAEKGLYQCWNQAAQLAIQPCLYYSTICDVITQSGLQEMTDIMIKNDLDVVISNPKIVSDQGEAISNIKWPIHYILRYLNYSDDVALYSGEDLAKLVPLFLPATLLGSSASNLYRSEVIKKHPFPLSVGIVGDSLWAVKYLPKLKVGITRKEYAIFCWDGVRNGTWDKDGSFMQQFSEEADKLKLEYPLPHIDYVIIHSVNAYITDECKRLQAAVNEYDYYVKFLTRPLGVKAKDIFFKYTSVRYWLGRLFPRE